MGLQLQRVSFSWYDFSPMCLEELQNGTHFRTLPYISSGSKHVGQFSVPYTLEASPYSTHDLLFKASLSYNKNDHLQIFFSLSLQTHTHSPPTRIVSTLTHHTTTIRLLCLFIKHLTLSTQIITLLYQTIQLHPPFQNRINRFMQYLRSFI